MMNFSLENFISFCDSMQIAEESRITHFKEEARDFFTKGGNSYAQKISDNKKSTKTLDASKFDMVIIDKSNYNNQAFIKNINQKYPTLHFNPKGKGSSRIFKSNNITRIFWVDTANNRTVASALIDNDPEYDGDGWIELDDFYIYKAYEGCHLSSQFLKQLIQKFNINILQIFNGTEVQQKMYEKASFKISPKFNNEGVKIMTRGR